MLLRMVTAFGFAAYQFLNSRLNRKAVPRAFTHLFVPLFWMGNTASLRMVKDYLRRFVSAT